MKHILRILTLLVAVLAALPALMASEPEPGSWDERAAKAKAEYIFLRAPMAETDASGGLNAMLLQRAWLTDSACVDYQPQWLLASYLLHSDVGEAINRRYYALKRQFYSYPPDLQVGLDLGHLAERISKFDEAIAVYQLLDSAFSFTDEPCDRLASLYSYMAATGSDTQGFDKAMSIYDERERARGSSRSTIIGKMGVYSAMSDTVAFASEIDRFIALDPTDMESYYLGALFCLEMGLYGKSAEICGKALEINPAYSQVYVILLHVKDAQDDASGFLQAFSDMMSCPTISYDLKHDLVGRNLQALSKLFEDKAFASSALELMAQIEPLHADDPDFLFDYAIMLGLDDQITAMGEKMAQFAEKADLDETNYLRVIAIIMANGDYDNALRIAAASLAKMPQSIRIATFKSVIQEKLGDHKNALKTMLALDLEHSDAPAEEIAMAYGQIGSLYANQRKYNKAIEYSLRAVVADPTDLMSCNNAAYFMALTDSDLPRAKVLAKRAVDGDPDNLSYLDTYAYVLFKMGECKSAKIYADLMLEAVGNDPEQLDAEPLDHIADIYAACGLTDQARRFWEAALQKEPGNKSIKRKLSKLQK